MASLARAAVRLTARNARGFRTSSRALAAQNFTMPALSPTMTEGNIASWRVKEGDKFAAGDVLLEIETDKATMDVEAQEDGILMKIMLGDGSKGVQVGSRIAVVAEEGDDISTLEVPAEEPKPQAAKEAAPEPPSQPQESSSAPAPKGGSPVGKPRNLKYPLLPSVSHLVNENGLDEAAVNRIPATGPNGRLLKGDVLAYLGKINAETPAKLSARFEHAAHLDLSNIKVAQAPETKKEAAKPAPVEEEPVEEDSFITLPVTLTAVIELQKKVNDTLGVFLPLSELIARAADVANDELPHPVGYQPSADELFNQVLGLDQTSSQGSRGYYLPQISALPPASLLARRPLAKQPDIIDILAAPSRPSAPKKKTQLLSGVSTGPNIFSLVVPKTEERRAEVFLERIKLILEKEPGRLVL
ncbi:hypothetical protein GQ53DRAFT_754831 [Thozetella sp. PMI_491]|nr:hypothetical protein GQ53DRAFT_754831 [Thozetella sp. PMI_491]